mgnify:CR=1 FL=1
MTAKKLPIALKVAAALVFAESALVLAGAGHAHALVLRALVQQPMPGVEVVVVSPQPLAPYSGMVPGWLAGRYRFDEICIDFAALAQAAGCRR